MKNFSVIVIMSFLMIACGNKDERSVEEIIKSEDLSEIKSKKDELSQQQSDLTSKIDQLDEAINRLDKNKSLPLVTIRQINDTLFQHYAEVQGNVVTDENVVIFPEVSGVVTNIYVKDGQQVSRGQVLARVDDGGLSSQLAQLKAQAALAKTTFERQQRLWDQKIGSEIQFLEAKTNYEASQSAVNQLGSQIARTTIKAPFSGIIDEIMIEQGEVVSPGQNQLFRLVNLNNMYVSADVPETYLSTIKAGTTVKIAISSTNQEFTGEVRQVGNFINPNNRTFKIEVAIPNTDGIIKPNLIATVKLNDYTAENALIIPENTVQQNAAGESIVYVLETKNDSIGVARRTTVKTGYVYQESIEVTSGLSAGETLIIEGARNLRDGQEVRIRN